MSRLTTLCMNMGLKHHVTWYSFRRLVLNAVDGAGSEEVRNQVAGHLESRTYRNSYQNQRIELDIPSLVLGLAAKNVSLIKQLNLVSADMDPSANIPLPLGAHDEIAALSDVEALSLEYRLAADLVEQIFGSQKDAPESDHRVRDRNRKMQKLRAKQEFYRSQLRSRLREEYFEQKNDMLIDAQLNKIDVDLPTAEAVAPWSPSMPERVVLAHLGGVDDIRSPDMLDRRIAAIQALANLCGRVEQPHRSAAKQESPAQDGAIRRNSTWLACCLCVATNCSVCSVSATKECSGVTAQILTADFTSSGTTPRNIS